MKATNPALAGRSFSCLTISMTSWCESCNFYAGAVVGYDMAAGTTPDSAEPFGDNPDGSASSGITGAASGVNKPKAPTNVKYSGTKAVTARFSVVSGVKYAISSTSKGISVKGSCRVRGTTASCSVHLPLPGRWKVTITPSKAGVSGTPTSKVIVWKKSVS
jgi:hypothetical protein